MSIFDNKPSKALMHALTHIHDIHDEYKDQPLQYSIFVQNNRNKPTGGEGGGGVGGHGGVATPVSMNTIKAS